MKIAITGAGGFIGQHVVAQALCEQDEIIAIVRSSAPSEWAAKSRITVRHIDLLRATGLQEVITGCELVIHLAAVMSGDNQYSDTLTSTQNLLRAMDKSTVKKLILLSSISVLDYVRKSPMSEINEDSAINRRDKEMGSYALMKRDQEDLCRTWATDGKRLVILRPGIVYDNNTLSPAHVGFRFLAAKHTGQVPVAHVNAVAVAAVACVSNDLKDQVIQLVNDELPNQREYIAKLKKLHTIGRVIPVPWKYFSLLMTMIRLPLDVLTKTPDSVKKNSVAARQKPFVFSNRKAKELLRWQPCSTLEN